MTPHRTYSHWRQWPQPLQPVRGLRFADTGSCPSRRGSCECQNDKLHNSESSSRCLSGQELDAGTLEVEVDQSPNILPCLLLDKGLFRIQMICRQKDCVNLRALRLHQALQIGEESPSSNCCLTASFPSFLWSLRLPALVSHFATSMVTFTAPGTLNASVPVSIFAIGMMPGEGIDSPSWR